MKTVVEWLVNEFNKESLIDLNQKTTMYLIVQQAKKMEKEQIIDAYAQGFIESERMDKGAEQYYNETFKNEKTI
jgi:hypothetical protein